MKCSKGHKLSVGDYIVSSQGGESLKIKKILNGRAYFDIVTYGLNSAPEEICLDSRSMASSFWVKVSSESIRENVITDEKTAYQLGMRHRRSLLNLR